MSDYSHKELPGGDEPIKRGSSLAKQMARWQVMRSGRKIEERVGDPDNPIDSTILAYFKAAANLPELDVLPDSINDIEKWQKENPEEALKLGDKLVRLSGEFGLELTSAPQEKQPEG